jgi:cobalt/nickel transport system permease protein
MKNSIPSYLLLPGFVKEAPVQVTKAKLSFIDKTILNSAKTVKSIYQQADSAESDNLINNINPHIKLVSLIYMAVVISIVSKTSSQLLISAFIFTLFIIARLKVFEVYKKILILAFLFGFLAALPASLNVITPGKIIFNLISFNRPTQFWIYKIPENIGLTENGIQVVLLIFLRVLNSVSIALLIVFTTPFPSFIKSFKIIGVPDTFLMIISLAYKYIFILSRTIEDTYFALRSRLLGNMKNSSLRKLISGRIFFIFKRSVVIYENTYFAMVSRGYDGKVKLHSQNHFTLIDFMAVVIIILAGIFVVIIN